MITTDAGHSQYRRYCTYEVVNQIHRPRHVWAQKKEKIAVSFSDRNSLARIFNALSRGIRVRKFRSSSLFVLSWNNKRVGFRPKSFSSYSGTMSSIGRYTRAAFYYREMRRLNRCKLTASLCRLCNWYHERRITRLVDQVALSRRSSDGSPAGALASGCVAFCCRAAAFAERRQR